MTSADSAIRREDIARVRDELRRKARRRNDRIDRFEDETAEGEQNAFDHAADRLDELLGENTARGGGAA